MLGDLEPGDTGFWILVRLHLRQSLTTILLHFSSTICHPAAGATGTWLYADRCRSILQVQLYCAANAVTASSLCNLEKMRA